MQRNTVSLEVHASIYTMVAEKFIPNFQTSPTERRTILSQLPGQSKRRSRPIYLRHVPISHFLSPTLSCPYQDKDLQTKAHPRSNKNIPLLNQPKWQNSANDCTLLHLSTNIPILSSSFTVATAQPPSLLRISSKAKLLTTALFPKSSR